MVKMRRLEARGFEEDLTILLKRAEQTPSVSLKEIVEILSGKGFSLILVFLSLPFCLPLQIPGLSVPFGIIIALLGLRINFGKQVWLPQTLLSKTISSSKIKKTAERLLKIMHKLRRLIHPRLQLTQLWALQIVNGWLIFLLGVMLALPLPIPFTNVLAGWSILLINIGLLEDDGIVVLIGYLFSIASLAYFIVTLLLAKNILNLHI